MSISQTEYSSWSPSHEWHAISAISTSRNFKNHFNRSVILRDTSNVETAQSHSFKCSHTKCFPYEFHTISSLTSSALLRHCECFGASMQAFSFLLKSFYPECTLSLSLRISNPFVQNFVCFPQVIRTEGDQSYTYVTHLKGVTYNQHSPKDSRPQLPSLFVVIHLKGTNKKQRLISLPFDAEMLHDYSARSWSAL